MVRLRQHSGLHAYRFSRKGDVAAPVLGGSAENIKDLKRWWAVLSTPEPHASRETRGCNGHAFTQITGQRHERGRMEGGAQQGVECGQGGRAQSTGRR